MNINFFFVLLVIAIIATACTPKVTDDHKPIVNAVQPAENVSVPVTGESVSTAARETQEPRLWSGEIYFSDNSNPDHAQNTQPAATETTQTVCMSEDSQPRPQSGCIE